MAADRSAPVTYFCGGSRNHASYFDVFDVVIVLEIDRDTLARRLALRPPDEFGAQASERELVMRLHRTGEGTPEHGIRIDATLPLRDVVDEVLRRTSVSHQ